MSITDIGLKIKAPDFLRRFLGLRPNTGNVFYVDSARAAAAPRLFRRNKSGRTPESAFPTLAHALNQVVANNDDLIIVGPTHDETAGSAAAINFNKAGVTIRGLGHGNFRPKIRIGTGEVVTSSVNFSAADIVISGIDFIAAIDTLTAPITVPTAADRLTMRDCRFYLGTGVTVAPTLWITLNANADDFLFEGNSMSNTVGITNSPAGFIDFAADPAWNYLPVFIDATLAAHNTVATHTIAEVTGVAEFRILPMVLTDMTSGGSATLTLGHYTDADGFVGSSAIAGFTAGKAWVATAPVAVFAPSAIINKHVSNFDIGYEIGTAALLTGTMRVYIAWKQGPTQSLVLPGAFGVLA